MKKVILGLLIIFGAQQIKTSPFWYKALVMGAAGVAGYIGGHKLNPIIDNEIQIRRGNNAAPFSLAMSTLATATTGWNAVSNNSKNIFGISRVARPLGFTACLGWMASGLTEWYQIKF